MRRGLWALPQMQRLAALTLLGFTSFFVTLAALPAYAVSGGAGRGVAGLVTTVMLVSTVAAQGLVPALERRIGVSAALALGLIALGGSAPLLALSDQLGWLLAISGVRGLGFAVLTVLGVTLASRIAPPGRVGEAVGAYGLAIAIPSLSAVPAGTALTLGGHFWVVAAVAAAPLLALPFVGMLGEVDGLDPASRPAARRSVARAVVPAAVVLAVITLAGGGFTSYLPIERSDGALAATALLVFGGAAAIARWKAGAAADRAGTTILLPGFLIAGAAGLLGVAAASAAGSDAALLASAAVFGAGYGAVQSLTLVVAFARAGPDATTTASATWNAAFDLGTAIGALVVGVLAAGAVGFEWTLALCAAAVAASIAVALASAP